MQNYNHYIKIALKKKYKGVTFFQNKILKLFFKNRIENLKLIMKKKNMIDVIKKNDTTFKDLNHLNNKKFNKNLEKKILIFHKKFEVNLSLKKNYTNKFKKKTNQETSVNSYLILGLLIYKSNFLDNSQKINSILKILDKVLLDSSNLSKCNYKVLINLINLENKLIKKILI